MPDCTSSHDEQDAVLVAQLGAAAEESGGRHDVAALALDRLDEDGGHFVGRHGGAKSVCSIKRTQSSSHARVSDRSGQR